MGMEMAWLQAFVAVAESGGFGKAAVVLDSTQPTVSRQVKALEVELGRPLFERLGRRIEPTAFGREALERARAILRESDTLMASASVRGTRAAGHLRLGVADSAVLDRFPKLLHRYQRKHPSVRVHVRTATSPEILDWVREGECDAGLCMVPQLHPDLLITELWADGFVGITSLRHPLAGEKVSLARFARERQIGIEPGTLSHQALAAAFHRAGLSYKPEMTFDGFDLIVDLVHAGTGVGVVSGHVASAALRRKRVAQVHVRALDRMSRSLGLAVHASREVDGALAAFLDEVDAMA